MKFDFFTYFEYIRKECLNYRVYLTAALIGAFICFLTDHYSVIPFLVPLGVQIIVRSNVKFRHRYKDALLELPSQTEDPAFIMDMEGKIVLSTGKTRAMFRKYGIRNIKAFINEASFKPILDLALHSDPNHTVDRSVETFSNTTLKWYEVKAQTTGLQYAGKDQKILVWFQDISFRKIYHLRLKDLLRYSGSLMTSLEEPVRQDKEYNHLAAFLLKEYEAVFITRTDDRQNLTGYVFKTDHHQMYQSDSITVSHESLAPINQSRMKKQILSNDMARYDSQEEFIENNPFDPVVLKFINGPIRNYITYNEADLSIIAFNFRSKITSYEKEFFEIVVNIYRSLVILVDLKNELERIKG